MNHHRHFITSPHSLSIAEQLLPAYFPTVDYSSSSPKKNLLTSCQEPQFVGKLILAFRLIAWFVQLEVIFVKYEFIAQ